MSEPTLRSSFGHWQGIPANPERFLLECDDGLHIVPAIEVAPQTFSPNWNPAGAVVCTVSYVGPSLEWPVTFVPEGEFVVLLIAGAILLALLVKRGR